LTQYFISILAVNRTLMDKLIYLKSIVMRLKNPFIKSAFVVLIALAYTAAYTQVTLPRTPSPAATVQQTIGISTVTVKYSRPSVKGREIWGKLVPYGYNVQAFGAGNSAPWRAGANENTIITFSNDAKVEGQPVPAGSYGLTFVINQDNSGEVILSKDYQSWGSFFYDQKQDLMRAKIQVRSIPETEMLTYDFMNDTKTSAELVLNWEKKQFPVKIEYDVDKIVLDNARQELKGATGFNFQGWASAANYALANKFDLDEGLKWADQAIAQNNSFNTLSLKANILKEMGKAEESTKIMNDATVIATEAELNAYGYQLLGAGNNDKAIEVLLLNTQRHPKSANTWDSLGEAYATKGDKKNAIINFKKSLSLNPPAGVKANSEKFLHQLGAM
jgi:tetratricopeptide (TPR) repeat protein